MKRTPIPRETRKGLDQESAVSLIDGFQSAEQLSFNPERLVKTRGLSIYTEMLTDDQIYAISTIKKAIILSPGWTVQPASDSKRDIAIADFVRWNFVRMPGTLRNVLFNVLTAMDYGFSITEKVWTLEKENPKYRGLIKLKKLSPKSPLNFDFDMDDFGNILNIEQQISPLPMIGSTQRSDPRLLDPKKFIHYAYNARFGNPYGTADLRAAFVAWIEKKMIRRFWSIYLERFGSPPVMAKIPRNATTTERNLIKEVLRNIQTRTGLTIPEGFEITLLEAMRSGHAGFETAIAEKNMAISHAILMPDLLGFSSGERPGSFALGKAHVDIFLYVLEKVARDLEDDIIAEQLIIPLVDMNFRVSDYPIFKFEPLKQESRSIRAKLISILRDAAVIRSDEPWIRDFVEIPKVTGQVPASEQEADEPLMDTIRKILEIIENREPPEQLEKPTQRRIGKSPDKAPSITPRAGRSAVEVQGLKVT
jgi:phage gp29-like protein